MNNRPLIPSHRGLTLVGLLLLTWVAGASAAPQPNPRNFASVMSGAKLYQNNCSTCHGPTGQGDANWRTPGPDGKFRPPPLNGSGHMWHHPLPVLLSTIRDGSIAQGGSMPAWKEKLSETEMVDIIAWLQSKWPKEVLEQWRQMDQRAQAQR